MLTTIGYLKKRVKCTREPMRCDGERLSLL